jgi:hypothetical protein
LIKTDDVLDAIHWPRSPCGDSAEGIIQINRSDTTY